MRLDSKNTVTRQTYCYFNSFKAKYFKVQKLIFKFFFEPISFRVATGAVRTILEQPF